MLLKPRRHVLVCVNDRPADDPLPCCAHKGGRDVYEALRAAVARAGLNREVWVTRTGCMVHCTQGPTVVVYPDDVWYGGVTVNDVADLLDHLKGGNPVQRLLLR